ncbi:MAG: hypothetical protein JKY42_06105, partial [Flavobacteriales bacterium]|nr:hypothetical protein [Flavobacteriales bacterium]
DFGRFGFGHGIEIGNMFRLVDSEPIAIGLKVTWFNAGFSGFKSSGKATNVTGFSVDLRALKLGPYFTYALTDQMAVDAFYQVAPTMTFGYFQGTYRGEYYNYPAFSYGLTHEVGVTYRFDILSVGVGWGLGGTKLKVDYYDTTAVGKFGAGTTRFFLGMKF